MKNYFKKTEKGITLVALIVTIVVLIILSTISISALFGDNGVLRQSKIMKETTANSTKQDEQEMQELLKEYNNMLQLESFPNEVNNDEEQGTTNTSDTNTTTEPEPTEPEPTGPAVIINGSSVTLTQDNVADYLGKIVTNYTGASSVTISGRSYTVSPTYRLYYVDFDDKYKEGAGTIYLKAECTSKNYALPVTDETSDTASNIKIRALNPSLYKTGVTPPTATNNNMKAVTWLTNTTNWASLADTSMSSNINYIVGAPSLEMMMDSYNTHYASIVGNATEPTASGSRSSSSTRTKLFYQYPYNSNNYGYGVGPGKSSAWNTYTDGYYTVQSDSAIDTMYYPGNIQYYWLASPSARNSNCVMNVGYANGGNVNNGGYDNYFVFCPVVSLKSSVQLQLQ